MLGIPSALPVQYEGFLQNRMVPNIAHHSSCLQWLRFYLDFCTKYHFSPAWKESLVHLLRKLDEKRQTKARQEQASQAVMLYYELVDPMGYRNDDPSPNTVKPPAVTPDGSSHRPVLSTRGAGTIQAAKPLHDAARGASPLTSSSVHEAYANERTHFHFSSAGRPQDLAEERLFLRQGEHVDRSFLESGVRPFSQ